MQDIAFIIYLWYDNRVLEKARKQKRLSAVYERTQQHEDDTDASELIQKKVFGSFGDAAGYEEDLYKTQDGKLFLYGIGGAESPYAEETIKRISAAKADEWLKA